MTAKKQVSKKVTKTTTPVVEAKEIQKEKVVVAIQEEKMESKESEVKKEVLPKEEEKSEVKKVVSKKTPTKTSVQKETVSAKKVTEKKETAPKKSVSSKKVTQQEKVSTSSKIKTALYIQYSDIEVEQQMIINRIKEVWVNNGNKLKDIKTLDAYVKPEEKAIYYVINGDNTGRIDL